MKHLFLASACLLTIGAATGCVEDGHLPDCPEQTFEGNGMAGADNKKEFDAWREKAEEANCVTPIGGKNSKGGAAGE